MYQYEISDVPLENIAYVDESGLETYLFREYGYAVRGEKVYDSTKGRNYARVGVVAAQINNKIIVPLEYTGAMNHNLFEPWFETMLLPALPKETIIVMDNASFHRKETLYCLAETYNCFVIFLPPYSPDLNPMEHFWNWLKSTLRKILPKFNSFDDALTAVFQYKEQLSFV